MKLKDIIEKKDGVVFSIPPGETIMNACNKLKEHNVGLLAVIENDTLLGVISERDVVRKSVLTKMDIEATPVSEIMSKEVISGDPEDTLTEALWVFEQHRFRHLPIVSENKVVGVITERDIILALLSRMGN